MIGEYDAELRTLGLADGDRAFNLTWHDWLNVENLLTISEVIALAAIGREDSRGAHFREDFPETGDLQTSAYCRVHSRDGAPALEMVPVGFTIVKPGESLIEGEAGAPMVAAT
jgi:fumarate reductase flavoprotein subunit